MRPLKFLSRIKNSKVSKTARIYPFSIIKDSVIGDYSYVSYNCVVNNCSIGKYCSIAKDVKIGLGIHPTYFISTSPLFYSTNNPLRVKWVDKMKFQESKRTIIGNDVWIGTNVVILDGVQVGDGAVLGANAVVNKDVEPYSIVGGVPAKLIRKRFSNEVISMIQALKWWDLPIEVLKDKDVLKAFSKIPEEKDIEIVNILKKS